MFLNTLLFLYVVWYRNYPPLRAKNIKLIGILYLSMMLWCLGTIGTNFNINGYFDFTSSCVLFALWFRILVGIFMYVFVHIFRLYVYIRIFKRGQQVTYVQYVVAGIVYAVIIAAYGIPVTLMRNKLTVMFVLELRTCVYGRLFTELSFGIVWAGWVAVLVVAYMARNINTSFKEYREMLLIVLLASVAIAYQTVVHHVVREYTAHRWARITSTFFEYLASQTSLVILLRVPVYNCIFHRREFRRKFFDKMKADGMAAQYGMTLPS
ncbi:hypothetical protein GGH12_000868 [Coemansia sp. RSA 1822]|nr:hypothetical protein LPJ76_000414 [Coemansia sp. RSA 638]KAJ2541031.1 hypothetical protein GGF49_004004 [Coemansia sp. RSA 1853]KAJ2566318.1 hypothetical protein GGH12_000868 [Coemansia sp. RSA 1822]